MAPPWQVYWTRNSRSPSIWSGVTWCLCLATQAIFWWDQQTAQSRAWLHLSLGRWLGGRYSCWCWWCPSCRSPWAASLGHTAPRLLVAHLGFLHGLPKVAVIEADFSALGEVDVYGQGMANVDDGAPWAHTSPTICRCCVFLGHVVQDNCSLENLYQVNQISNCDTDDMHPALPVLYFLVSHGSETLAPEVPFKCSTILWATQLRSPYLSGAKFPGSDSLMG